MPVLTLCSYFLVAGISAYAAMCHLNYRFGGDIQRTHRLFGWLCVLLVPYLVMHAMAMLASDEARYIALTRWSVTTGLLSLALLPWYTAEHTGYRPTALLVALTTGMLLAIAANLALPYTLQFDTFHGLQQVNLPWGERITVGAGELGISGFLFFFVLAGICYYCFVATLRRHAPSRRPGAGFLLGCLVFTACGVQGLLVRSSIIQSVDLAPFSFLLFALHMSLSLNRDSQDQIQRSERHFRALVEQSPVGIQLLRPDGTTLKVNAAWERIWGHSAALLEGHNVLEDERVKSLGSHLEPLQRALAGETIEIPAVLNEFSDPGTRRDRAEQHWVSTHLYPVRDEAGEVDFIVGVSEDVSESRRAEQAIKLIASGVCASTGEGFFQQLCNSLAELFSARYAYIGCMDENDPDWMKILSFTSRHQGGDIFPYHLGGTPDTEVLTNGIRAFPKDARHHYPDHRLLQALDIDGFVATPLRDRHGQPLGILAVMDNQPLQLNDNLKEILEIFAARAGAELRRVQADEHIRQLAYYDYLTGLANRAHLHEHLSETLREIRASDGSGALLMIDLDHFKTINDALSHDIGDEVLRAVARRLRDVVGNRGFLARLGGDEFAVVMHDHSAKASLDMDEVQALASQLMEKLLSPLFVEERAFTLGASIGVVMLPQGGESELDVMRHADMALYRAKHLGRGNIQFYSPDMQEIAARRLLLEDGLRRAVGNHELDLYFQPQVNARGEVIGAEVLLRWSHPELGNIMPDSFIPIAEETGLIHSVGRWVFDQACARFTAWREQGIDFNGYISINVCPWQFNRADFVEQIRHALHQHNVDPGDIMIELTETALLYDLEEAVERLHSLRALGIRVALDDFGTGYSSLAYLRDLPLDQLKIDKSFIAELDSSVEHPLVESMIAIGGHLGIPVVAEGVETVTQRSILQSHGCERYQGFYFSRPLAEADFLHWLEQHQSRQKPPLRPELAGPANLTLVQDKPR